MQRRAEVFGRAKRANGLLEDKPLGTIIEAHSLDIVFRLDDH
jgi:hypothetical protein